MTIHTEFLAVDPEKRPWVEMYELMNSIVQPRPIAWIATISANGVHNLAPFSYFSICSMKPPIISNSIFYKRDGSEKDTLANIKATRHYVVGTVSFDVAGKANQSSAGYASDVDEFVEADVKYVDRSPGLPRLIAESPVQLICELHQLVSLGEGAGVGTLVLGRVHEILLSRKLEKVRWEEEGLPPDIMNNVGRMGGDYYSKTSDLFTLSRPTTKK